MSEQILKEILESMHSLTKTVGSIQSEQQTMKSDMQIMKSDIQEIKEEQVQIKQAVLETNERVTRIEAKQEHQQTLIEILSARSIDQEATMKQIL